MAPRLYQLVEYADPLHFRDVVMDRLLQSEAESCAQLGLIQRMTANGYTPVSADELDQPLLLTVQDNRGVELVALQTYKKAMLVSRGSPEAMSCLAESLAGRGWAGQGILGPTPSVETLAERYAFLSRRPHRLVIRLRTFQISAVMLPHPVSGFMRQCIQSDRELLARFVGHFAAAIGESSEEDTLSTADRLIDGERIFFWMDPQPVAMAAWAGRTPNGVRINFVYTPPGFRCRGYASNLVARLTQSLLDEGRKLCFLHTDQANPTSNSIYQKIGYRPVCDSERWEFGYAAGRNVTAHE